MPLRTGTEMPELDGATEWVQGEANTEALKGTPTLIHFWAMSCYMCKNNLPTLREWEKTYGPKGLKFVAIHAPRGPEDMDVQRVKDAIAQFEMKEPAAVDNTHALAERFQISGLWPHYFLFDADGKLRNRAAGDAGLKLMEGTLKRLMDAPAPASVR